VALKDTGGDPREEPRGNKTPGLQRNEEGNEGRTTRAPEGKQPDKQLRVKD